MWSPPSTYKDLEAGSAPYGRLQPRRSKPIGTLAAAAAPGHQPSPFLPSSASAVPFSWEHRPGIPKIPGTLAARSTGPLLPLPPPLRSATGGALKKRPVAADKDPFAAALAECAKGPPGPDIEVLFSRSGSVAGRSRWAAWSISDRLGFFGLHASCKATCAVADSTVYVPRSRSRTGSSYTLSNRRYARPLPDAKTS